MKTLALSAALSAAFSLGFASPAIAGRPAADEVTLTTGPGLEIAGSQADRRLKLSNAGETAPLHEGDTITLPPGASAEMRLSDGTVLRIAGPASLALPRLREDARTLDTTTGATFLAHLGPIPTRLSLGGDLAVQGARALVALRRTDDGRTILNHLQGEALELSGGANLPGQLKAGQELEMPAASPTPAAPGATGTGPQKNNTEDCRARTFTFAGRRIVLPDGVSARLESGRLVIRACPGLKGSVVVIIGGSAVALGPDGVLTLSLTGQILSASGSTGNIRPLTFPVDSPFETIRDASPTSP
jgi:hypothetical protein